MGTAVRQKINLLNRTFDPAGRLTGVSAPGGFSTAIGYNGFGLKSSVSHSDGTSGSFTWDLLNRQTGSSWSGGTPISEQLAYDQAGNISNIVRENGSYTVAYDSINQILSSAGLESRSYSYDANGNRVQDSINGPGTFISDFLVSNGVSSYLSDPDGFGDTIRETSAAGVKSYAYRADDLLNAFQFGLSQAAYYFDALGRRVAKVFNIAGQTFTQSYVFLGKEPQILLGKAGDGTITTYLDGADVGDHLGELRNGVFKGYVTDHLGSVLNGDAAGSSHRFGLFGQSSSSASVSVNSSPVSYGFGGYEYDAESKNYHTHYREYDPNVGRWLSQDPIGIFGGMNNYAYLKNSSQMETDPSGQGVGLALLCLAAHGVVGAADSAMQVRNYEAHIKDLDKLINDTDTKITDTLSKAGGVTNLCKSDAEYIDKLNELKKSYIQEQNAYTQKIAHESLGYMFAFHGVTPWAATCLAALLVGPL